eukprot:m.229441 g.229441  ORF g.229441 m.229441 type:complete len:522 (-) comp17742_c0_seq1:38-1603(-)
MANTAAASGGARKKHKGAQKDLSEAVKALGTVDKIKALGKKIAGSLEHANGIVDLLAVVESEHTAAELKVAASQALVSAFAQHKPAKPEKGDPQTAAGKLMQWLHEQYLAFITALLTLFSKEEALQKFALDTVMGFVKSEAAAAAPQYCFPHNMFDRVVAALVEPSTDRETLLSHFNEQYIKFDDLRHNCLKALAKVIPATKLADEDATQIFCNNVFMILHHLPSPATDTPPSSFYVKTPKGHALREAATHRRVFSDCWMAFLALPLPMEILKAVLTALNDDILPHLTQPKLLLDFLTDAYNTSGPIPILALHSLFTLIYQHNLDYPDFYPKLYALFKPSVLFARHRARFFTLAHTFLTSTHLPAYLVAAFAKRIARLMLVAPPGGQIMLTQLLYNLLKRHPACKFLIHRIAAGSIELARDPYQPDATDLVHCGAMESSVWETQSLLNHYHPSVPGLPVLLQTPALRKQEFRIEKAAKLTYSTLLQKEFKKPLGETPPATVFTPANTLFAPTDPTRDLFKW